MKNVHDLLAKLAWDFSPEQLDHLFDCFKVSKSLNNQAVTNYEGFCIPCTVSFSSGLLTVHLKCNITATLTLCPLY